MIRNNFDAEAGGRLQGMLETGNVRRIRRTAHDREAEAFGGNEVRVGAKFFETKEVGDAAWILWARDGAQRPVGARHADLRDRQRECSAGCWKADQADAYRRP